MPIRYFLAMCLATLVLAAMFLISIPSETVLWSAPEEPSQNTAEPLVVAVSLPPSEARVLTPEPGPLPPPVDPSPVSVVSISTIPTDRGGLEVARVVAPEFLSLPGLESLVDLRISGQSRRELPTKISTPEPHPKPHQFRPPMLRPSPGLKPSNPVEAIPADLTKWTQHNALRPVFLASPAVSAKAREPGDLPRLPVLSRPPSLKAPLEDPLAEVGNEAIVNRPCVVVFVTATFLKLGLPDPFAYGEQIRWKIDEASEPDPAPVSVNPRRPS